MAEPRFERVALGDVVLHVATMGKETLSPIVFLHGFPEYWAGWRDVMERLANDFFLIAPDQRGYNLSSKPQGVESYKTRHIVADLAALADRLLPGRTFALAGHDWGASVAYAFAFAHPQRLTHLVVANGVHPWCFQNAIHEDPAQRAASQYINTLRDPASDRRMAEDDFRRTLRMIDGFSDAAWLTPRHRAGYLEAWRQPGALQAMLNWYRASPIDVPLPEATAQPTWVQNLPDDAMRVRVPHLVIWGEADRALRPSCLSGLERLAPQLRIERVAGAGHWVLHEKPDAVAGLMSAFLR
jgi:pimeloyl-ACP methyl ester carboxylesterase